MDSFALMQLAMAFVGAVGFSLFFNVSPRYILPASLGGLVTWVIYWALNAMLKSLFIPSMIASIFAAIYAELAAKRYHVPTATFFIIAIIPLVPGRGLFYTMSAAVNADWVDMSAQAIPTLQLIAGIAIGICIVTAAVQTWVYAKERMVRILERRKRREDARLDS